MDLFSKYKEPLKQEIEKAIAERKEHYAAVNPWGGTAADMLSQFAVQGKLIRGSLVLFSEEIFGGEFSEDALKIAAALEIIHSGLLIHDDIMDNDPYRRGKLSIHKQFEQIIKGSNAKHFGMSLAMCTGDLAYFLSGELLGIVNHPNAQLINRMISHEVSLVGIAQMQDVSSAEGIIIDEQQILRTYKYKTGRYSISLPLSLGAMLQNQDAKVIQELEKFGEKAGILFQLTDDTLSLFGKQEDTGKLLGSDIKENKNTIYKALIFASANTDEIKKLETIFGNSELDDQDFGFVRDLIKKYNVDKEVSNLCQKYEAEAIEIADKLPISEEYKKRINGFVSSLLLRIK